MGSAYRAEFTDTSPDKLEEQVPMLEDDSDDAETKVRVIRKRNRSICKDVDSGWAWVVLFSAFFMFMLGNGAQFAFGVMYSSIRRHFQTTKATTSWILLLQRGTGSGFGIVAGAMARKYGFRFVMITGAFIAAMGFIISFWVTNIVILFITMGLMVGIGDTMIMLASLVSIQFYFDKRRPLANGIALSGVGFGMMVLPPFYRFLLDRYEWQGTSLIFGGILLNGVVLGALLRPHTLQIEKKLEKFEEKKTRKYLTIGDYLCMKLMSVIDVNICSNPQFILYVIGFFLLQSGHITPPAYLPDRALELGFTKYQAATLVSAMGVTNTLCRALGGILGDGTPVRRQILFASCLLIAGICTLVSVALTTFWQLIIYAALFGLFKGTYHAQYPGVLVDIVGLSNNEWAMGIAVSLTGLATFVAIPLAGWVADLTGSYNWTFVMSGLLQCSGSFFLYMIPITGCMLHRRLYERFH